MFPSLPSKGSGPSGGVVCGGDAGRRRFDVRCRRAAHRCCWKLAAHRGRGAGADDRGRAGPPCRRRTDRGGGGAQHRGSQTGGVDDAPAHPRPAVRALWRAITGVPETAWQPAEGMDGAEVAEVCCAPAGRPADTRAIVPRVPVAAENLSADPRARRWRTFDLRQLQLGLGGHLDTLYSHTMIVTDLPGDGAEIEAWFRHRAQVEERIKDSKLGMALHRSPDEAAPRTPLPAAGACLPAACDACHDPADRRPNLRFRFLVSPPRGHLCSNTPLKRTQLGRQADTTTS